MRVVYLTTLLLIVVDLCASESYSPPDTKVKYCNYGCNVRHKKNYIYNDSECDIIIPSSTFYTYSHLPYIGEEESNSYKLLLDMVLHKRVKSFLPYIVNRDREEKTIKDIETLVSPYIEKLRTITTEDIGNGVIKLIPSVYESGLIDFSYFNEVYVVHSVSDKRITITDVYRNNFEIDPYHSNMKKGYGFKDNWILVKDIKELLILIRELHILHLNNLP